MRTLAAITMMTMLAGCGQESSTQIPRAKLTLIGGITFNYGTVTTGSAVDQTFTFENSGNLTATQMSAVIVNSQFLFPGGYPGTGGTCAATLAIGTRCTVVIRFAPTFGGLHQANVNFGYADGNGGKGETLFPFLQGGAN